MTYRIVRKGRKRYRVQTKKHWWSSWKNLGINRYDEHLKRNIFVSYVFPTEIDAFNAIEDMEER